MTPLKEATHLPWSERLALSRGLCCVEDIRLIKALITEYQPISTIIIGAGSGTMSLAWLESRAQLSIRDMRLWSIEIDPVNIGAEQETWRACRWGESPSGVLQLQGNSPEVGYDWDDGAVDMIIVDGDHSGAGLMADLAAWTPHLRPGGILVLHDYEPNLEQPTEDNPTIWEGVKQVANRELVPPEWTFLTKQGWSGAWQKAI